MERKKNAVLNSTASILQISTSSAEEGAESKQWVWPLRPPRTTGELIGGTRTATCNLNISVFVLFKVNNFKRLQRVVRKGAGKGAADTIQVSLICSLVMICVLFHSPVDSRCSDEFMTKMLVRHFYGRSKTKAAKKDQHNTAVECWTLMKITGHSSWAGERKLTIRNIYSQDVRCIGEFESKFMQKGRGLPFNWLGGQVMRKRWNGWLWIFIIVCEDYVSQHVLTVILYLKQKNIEMHLNSYMTIMSRATCRLLIPSRAKTLLLNSQLCLKIVPLINSNGWVYLAFFDSLCFGKESDLQRSLTLCL